MHMPQSSPLKPEVHCDVPEQPVLCALLDSSVRFACVAIGFPHSKLPQLLPLRTTTSRVAAYERLEISCHADLRAERVLRTLDPMDNRTSRWTAAHN